MFDKNFSYSGVCSNQFRPVRAFYLWRHSYSKKIPMETESSHCLGVTITFIALFQQIYTIGVASFLSLSCTNVETTITHLTIHNFVRIWPDQVPSYKLWPFSTIPKNQPQKGFLTKFSSINLLCKLFAFQFFHTKFSCSNFMF